MDVKCVSSSLGSGHASVVEPEVLEHPLARPDVARDQILVDLDRRVAARSGLNTYSVCKQERCTTESELLNAQTQVSHDVFEL